MPSAAVVDPYCDSAGLLTPQQEWAVTATWLDEATSPPAVMCDAWAAVTGCNDWAAAEAAAAAAGAIEVDAAAAADRAAASVSVNRVREVWVDVVSDIAAGLTGGPGRIAHSWLVDAALTLNAVLGMRIAVEASAYTLAAFDPPARSMAARVVVRSLYGAIHPDPVLVLRAVRQAGAFVHRGRCYLLQPSTPASGDLCTSTSGVARRGYGVWALAETPVD